MQNNDNVERRNWEIRGEKGENNVENDQMREENTKKQHRIFQVQYKIKYNIYIYISLSISIFMLSNNLQNDPQITTSYKYI